MQDSSGNTRERIADIQMDTVAIAFRQYLFEVCCALSPGISADSEFGIFKTSDDGQTWQSFDSAIAMSADACADPEVIASTSADSMLAIETKLFVANPGSNINRQTFNPDTLERDNENGTIIYPKHVQKALRRHLGLENTAVDEAFQFTNTEDFAFFG
jgi:hypothetical protein